VNHRLNAFGYLYLGDLEPEYAQSGNAGQLDLVLALEWVRANIAEFGGDPSRVLIFGQSGGGAKCAALMATPAAKGLFHRVLTMSGQQIKGASIEIASGRTKTVTGEDGRGAWQGSGGAVECVGDGADTGRSASGQRGLAAGGGQRDAAAEPVRPGCTGAIGDGADDPGEHARRNGRAQPRGADVGDGSGCVEECGE
jgi:hypothetical protein